MLSFESVPPSQVATGPMWIFCSKFLFIWPPLLACGILVSRPGIKSRPSNGGTLGVWARVQEGPTETPPGVGWVLKGCPRPDHWHQDHNLVWNQGLHGCQELSHPKWVALMSRLVFF